MLLEILYDLVGQRVHKITVRRGRLAGSVHSLDPCVDIVGHGLVISSLVDIALIQHVAQHFAAPLGVLLRVRYRIQCGRALGDACDSGTFRKGQLRYIFIKISFCRGLDSERVLSEVNRVHVAFQYLLFAHLFLDLESKELFLELSLQTVVESLLFCKFRKDVILDQLLGQRTRAFREIS